jgi:hypothetical protein
MDPAMQTRSERRILAKSLSLYSLTASIEFRRWIPYHIISLNRTDWCSGMLKCIWEVLGLNLSWDTGYLNWGFPWISSVLHKNSWVVPRFRHDCFLPNTFQFIIIHLSSSHPTLYSFDPEKASLNNIQKTPDTVFVWRPWPPLLQTPSLLLICFLPSPFHFLLLWIILYIFCNFVPGLPTCLISSARFLPHNLFCYCTV